MQDKENGGISEAVDAFHAYFGVAGANQYCLLYSIFFDIKKIVPFLVSP